jgi:hypothetical protein
MKAKEEKNRGRIMKAKEEKTEGGTMEFIFFAARNRSIC